ncbi:GT-D fold domain-containing glycosyltransferase [Bacillus paranthracis]|uniref:GT-D fold domain-containing glycosyltransferase n=1 Tax=Bacillus paranthracis TaxID=2026186 RepID=UPI0025505786|nr:GT-D fold domain-containing glycosyltransferase [Bacillus paranthracis]MDK7539262.1 GT-D fold domain-containing glycosyltransferase [Bacillus paranthracis]
MEKKINVFYRLTLWMNTIFYFLFSMKSAKHAKFSKPVDTVRNLKLNNRSLIRFGDGEFNIISGKGIHYQSFSKDLQLDLTEIIEGYIDNGKSVRYDLALPADFLKCNGLRLIKKRIYVSSWSYSRWIFKKKYDKPVVYGDAFLFARDNEKIYSELWKGAKTVIFVHNDKKYAENFSQKYKLDTKFIQIPSTDAYEKKLKILDQIYGVIEKYGNTDVPILISAGPCGKVLVKELANKGYLAYDTGHCWDDPLAPMSK